MASNVASSPDPSVAFSNPDQQGLHQNQKIGLALVGLGVLGLLVALLGGGVLAPTFTLLLSLGGMGIGTILYAHATYKTQPAGVRNNGVYFRELTARGGWAWMLAVIVTAFYVLLYFYPAPLQNLIRMADPLSMLIVGQQADQWFLYGMFYTMAILVMGVKGILKYRHSAYQIRRIGVIMFVQLFFAFLIPYLMKGFNQPDYYFSYLWPLQYRYLFPDTIARFQESGALGQFLVFWSVASSFLATPFLTYFYGKRWYCSWVCGCGGLANTAGDPFRHLSDKSLGAWKIERWLIHSVLVLIVAITGLLWINAFTYGDFLGQYAGGLKSAYGFAIGNIFSGVIGVGFYPLMGTRVWCRFGCPMAAYLGILQKYFSRFRITTNGGQCISCGNCSTYCEMGIDVKWYAQRGQNVVRASCVGCGICSTVCPRGVLKLENGPRTTQYGGPIELSKFGVKVEK